MEIECKDKCGNLAEEGSIYCEVCEEYNLIEMKEKADKKEVEKYYKVIFDNEKLLREKIDKIKDMIRFYEKQLEFNMLGTVDIKSINKRLKDIVQ